MCTEVWLMWSKFLAVLNFHINSENLDLCQVRLNLAAALLRLDDSMEDVRVLKGIWWKWRVGRLLQQNFYPKPLSLEAKTSCCFCQDVDVDVQESKVIKLCNEVVALDSSNPKATSGGVGEVWFQLRQVEMFQHPCQWPERPQIVFVLTWRKRRSSHPQILPFASICHHMRTSPGIFPTWPSATSAGRKVGDLKKAWKQQCVLLV